MRRWLIWTVVVVAWTILLESPVRPPQGAAGEWIGANRYPIAKTLHIGTYACLAVLSAWVPLAPRYRPAMMLFLMAHATITELLQELLEPYFHRGGSLHDVGFDQLGILIGFALSWKWWTRPE